MLAKLSRLPANGWFAFVAPDGFLVPFFPDAGPSRRLFATRKEAIETAAASGFRVTSTGTLEARI